MGTRDGSIIATIITTHIPMNEAAAPRALWPGIRIHVIDMIQPPGMRMPPGMDPHQRMTAPALTTNTRALAARNPHPRAETARSSQVGFREPGAMRSQGPRGAVSPRTD